MKTLHKDSVASGRQTRSPVREEHLIDLVQLHISDHIAQYCLYFVLDHVLHKFGKQLL